MPSIRSTAIAVVLSTVATAAIAQAPSPVDPAHPAVAPRTITTTGSGEASGAPDEASTRFTVLRSAETARKALDDANKAMGEVIASMKELGIEGRDLQTSGFSISPQYQYDNDRSDGSQNPPKIVGYEVRNSLTVKSRDIARIGEILDKAVTLGVNEGGDISFEVADPKPLRDEARRKAVADATATAKLLAEAAGVKLGEVREIDVVGGELPPVPMARSMKMMAAEPAPAVPVETGESTMTANVRMVFTITD